MTDIVSQDTFWTRLQDIVAGMMHIPNRRPFPMSHYVDRENNALWFITARGTALAEALSGGAVTCHYVVASRDGQLYATIEGSAQEFVDPEKKDDLWNVVADAWFKDGQKDPDAVLLRLDLTEAEVWATSGSLGFLYEIAKAQVTGDKPDVGEHSVLKFAA